MTSISIQHAGNRRLFTKDSQVGSRGPHPGDAGCTSANHQAGESKVLFMPSLVWMYMTTLLWGLFGISAHPQTRPVYNEAGKINRCIHLQCQRARRYDWSTTTKPWAGTSPTQLEDRTLPHLTSSSLCSVRDQPNRTHTLTALDRTSCLSRSFSHTQSILYAHTLQSSFPLHSTPSHSNRILVLRLPPSFFDFFPSIHLSLSIQLTTSLP